MRPERPGVSVLTYVCDRKRPNLLYILTVWRQDGMSIEQRYVVGGEKFSDVVLAFCSGMVIWKKVCNGDHTECIVHTTIFLANSLAVAQLPIVSQSADEGVYTIMNVDWSTTDVRSFLKVLILQHRWVEQSESFTDFDFTFCF